jgi:phosphoglycerate dehydrogenase-like enzyme
VALGQTTQKAKEAPAEKKFHEPDVIYVPTPNEVVEKMLDMAKVKKGVRIVNAARGELIDDDALLAALDSGQVAGAGLDVHTQEPPKDWKLAAHEKVIATPHIGGFTEESVSRATEDAVRNILEVLK